MGHKPFCVAIYLLNLFVDGEIKPPAGMKLCPQLLTTIKVTVTFALPNYG
jgi:hypothetical protein